MRAAVECPYVSRRYKPLDPAVPEDARRQLDEMSEDYDRRAAADAERRVGKAKELTEEARGRLRELLGDEGLRRLRETTRAERIAMRDLLQPPHGLEADLHRVDAERRARGQAVMDQHSSSDAIRGVARDYADRIRGAVASELVRAEHSVFGDWLEEGRLDVIVRPVTPPPDPHAFTTFRPPYAGWQIGWDQWSSSNFVVNRTWDEFVDPNVGLVGHDLFLDNSDASDFDNGWGNAHSQLIVDWKAPATGLVEVVVEAQSGLATHDLRTSDEWGWSDSSTTQQNFLMMHVIHPNVTAPSFAPTSSFNIKTDGSSNVHREFIARGQTFVSQLFSDGPVGAGEWLEVRAGTASNDGSITNDVEIHSKSAFHWSLKALHVRIAP